MPWRPWMAGNGDDRMYGRKLRPCIFCTSAFPGGRMPWRPWAAQLHPCNRCISASMHVMVGNGDDGLKGNGAEHF